jgi:hypothetical protein
MGGWVKAGPFEVWRPQTEVLPEHEHQAVGIRQPGNLGLLACSRAEWAEFVKRAKAGDLDVEVPPR